MTTERHHDPRGVILCDVCEAIGRPAGGVVSERPGSRVHISFELPDGWTYCAGDVHCARCSLASGRGS